MRYIKVFVSGIGCGVRGATARGSRSTGGCGRVVLERPVGPYGGAEVHGQLWERKFPGAAGGVMEWRVEGAEAERADVEFYWAW